MRSFASAMVLAASFALLVPDNQSLRAAESYRALPVVASVAIPTASATDEAPAAPGSNASWLLALGFLAAVISRRLGSE